jgi:hypothetical protein
MKYFDMSENPSRHRRKDNYNIERKVSFSDMEGMHVRDIKAKYGIDDKELNRQIRHETYDCNEAQTKEFSNHVYFKGTKGAIPTENPLVKPGTGKDRM